jgi:hypothetical protein
MDFRNMQTSELTLVQAPNNTGLSCPIPPELQQDLYTKRVGIQDLVIDTSQIPRFIPQVALTKNVFSVLNYRAGSNADYALPPPLATNLNIDVLNYFINYRAKDNSSCYTSYVMWNDPNNLPPPRVADVDELSVYLLPYFFCHNFMDFISMVQYSINVAIETVVGNPIPDTQKCLFKYDASTKTYQLSVAQQYLANFDIEFSESLYELFRFQSTQINVGYNLFLNNAPVTTRQLVWNDRFELDGVLYYNAVTDVKNTIFPFDLFFLTTNLPLQQTYFINSADQNIAQAEAYTILHKWRIQGNALELQEYLNIQPENLSNRLKSLTGNKVGDTRLRFQLYVRTRREQELIEWQVPQNEQIQMSLATYSVI